MKNNSRTISGPNLIGNSPEQKKELSHFIHKTGHEIGNPLTSIISIASILERLAGNDEKLSDYVRTISLEAWRVFYNMQAVVQILSQKNETARSCDLEQAVRESMLELSKKEEFEALRLRISSFSSALSAFICPAQLRFAICELLKNADQAMRRYPKDQKEPDGIIRVEISEQGKFAKISVHSVSAKRIDCAALSDLAQAYVKGERSVSQPGLGLTVCAAIMNRFSGKLQLEEKDLGDGCYELIAELYIPAKAQDKEKLSATNSLEDLSKEPASSQRELSLLIIEDEQIVASALEKLIPVSLGDGFSIDLKCIGAETAIETLLGDKLFDIVICDVNLGSLSGLQIFEEVIKTKDSYKMRFVFLTGERGNTALEEQICALQCPLLHKPFEALSLRDMIIRIADQI